MKINQLLPGALRGTLLLGLAVASFESAGADTIDAAELNRRYENLWRLGQDGAPVKLPELVVHLGIPKGNQHAVIAMLGDKASVDDERRWAIDCAAANSIDLVEEVFDDTFGVAKLAITRHDALDKPLECVLALDGHRASITLPATAELGADFSFLAFSCNEPFKAERGGVLARDLSLWQRMELRADGEDSGGLLPTSPEFVLGLGDQVYVDPDPQDPKGISFMNGTRSENFLIDTDPENLVASFKVLYRYNFALPPLANTLSKMPSMMMWDDHEVRDGWGSQDDEHESAMQDYFSVARHAFIAYQLLRSYPPQSIDQSAYQTLIDGGASLHRQFHRGRNVHVLMLDSRSTRSKDTPLFDVSSRVAVTNWLKSGGDSNSDLFVLTSGVPLFASRRVENPPVETELDDDLRDGWGSDRNSESRDELAGLLSEYFLDNPEDRLLVLSGDVHYSSAYYLSIDDKVIGHEIVTSGIAHALPPLGNQVMTINDAAQDVGRFAVTPVGKIGDSASFAELVVRTDADGAQLDVDLVFHVNGTKVRADPDHVLANTNLIFREAGMAPPKLWYYPYQYKYKHALDHLPAFEEARKESPSLVPAGSIMGLEMEIPELRVSFFSWLFRLKNPSIKSAIQAQSSFCSVPGFDYDNGNAQNWDLEELRGMCEPLTK